jgi:hypothetical protein
MLQCSHVASPSSTDNRNSKMPRPACNYRAVRASSSYVAAAFQSSGTTQQDSPSDDMNLPQAQSRKSVRRALADAEARLEVNK